MILYYRGMQAEVPGRPGEFLVFPFGLLWNEVTASSLLLVDMVRSGFLCHSLCTVQDRPF